MRAYVLTTILVIISWTAAAPAADDQSAQAPAAGHETAKAIEQMTGARTKIVWARSVNGKGHFLCEGSDFRLMGFDTKQGQEREILPGPASYAQPMITPDGTGIIYTDASTIGSEVVYLVDWEGKNRQRLVDGYAHAVSRNPKTGTQWVYVAKRAGNLGNITTWGPITRYNIAKPSESELVWDKTRANWRFTVSADGTRAGGELPGGKPGVADLPNLSLKTYGEGCQASISPDGNYFFHMLGGHHAIVLYEYGAQKRRQITLDDAPGINRHECWCPRWSTDNRFLTMDGPYSRCGVSAGAHIYLGQFNSDFTKVIQWIEVSKSTKTSDMDTHSYCWIESKADRAAAATREAPRVAATGPALPQVSPELWPGPREDVLFLWENRKKPSIALNTAGLVLQGYEPSPRGQSRFDRHYAMELFKGAFTAEGLEKHLLSAWKKSDQLSLELTVTPGLSQDKEPSSLMALSAGVGKRDFLLAQEKDKLVLHLLTAEASEAKVELGPLTPGKAQHVIVSYRAGALACYVNGKPAAQRDDIHVDFAAWRERPLVFGDEAALGCNWTGKIEGVAFYGRSLDAQEAADHYAKYAKSIAARKNIDRLEVQAKLVARSPVPTYEEVVPYRRALSVYEYEVEKVIAGSYSGKKIRVAHWGMMDRQVLPISAAQLNQSGRLVLERFSDHPELEAESLTDTLEVNPQLILYYCLEPSLATP